MTEEDLPLQCSAVPTVRVEISPGSYDIAVERGLMANIGELIRPRVQSGKVAIVGDSNALAQQGARLLLSLRSTFDCVIESQVPSGERNKTLAIVDRIYGEILQHKIDRNTPLVAMGGGVTGDIAGFVAATVLRGIPFVQVPTTLLAMVDASVGGKTGIDHPRGKNLIGAFHQPIAVFIDPEVLSTLPPRELRNGLAECIKHVIIRDADGFASLEKSIDRALSLDMHYLTGLIAHNVAIKARVVESDPVEKGERAHLNFGHTFGHAIENVSNFEYSHGESVALGMCAASRLAVDLKMLDEASRTRIVDLISRAGLPTRGLKLNLNAVIDSMGFDKKAVAGELRFVLPDRIGHVVICDDAPPDRVRAALESLQD